MLYLDVFTDFSKLKWLFSKTTVFRVSGIPEVYVRRPQVYVVVSDFHGFSDPDARFNNLPQNIIIAHS